MKILVLGINYYPEPTGISVYTTDMCEYLADAGHEVVVCTGFPYYPQWKVEKQYRKKLVMTEIHRRVKIKRSYLYIPSKVTTKTRILHETSFVVSSFFNSLFSRRPDIIIVISPPLLLGISAWLLSRLRKTPFVFHIQDLQPDTAVALGMIKSQRFIDVLYKIERFIYKRAAYISVISNGMRKKLILKGIPKEKFGLFPNWANITLKKKPTKENEFRKKYNLNNEFIASYSGNIGVKQGLDIILDVANSMVDVKNILFLIVGDGAQKQYLIEKARDLNLPNVKFLPPQPIHLFSEMLFETDISLVIQRAAVTNVVTPSKLLNSFASGRAVVVSTPEDSELSKTLREANCAVTVKPESRDELKDAILELYNDARKRELLGKNAKRYADEHFSRERILSKFESELTRIRDTLGA